MDFQTADLITVGLLVALEGLLSADNAMVLAVLVIGLPKHQQRKALQYGIVGAFVFRIAAILLATFLVRLKFVMLVGAAYLLWLPYAHFTGHGDAATRRRPQKATSLLGMSPFWSTVAKVELTDIVFAVDSILVAVAMSNKLWVIITGGVLGIIAMRLVVGRLISLVQRYPALVDGAFVIIAWGGIKLVLEFLHTAGYVAFAVPKWFSLGAVVVIFVAAFIYAQWLGPVEEQDDPMAGEVSDLLREEDRAISAIDGDVTK